MSKPFVSLYVVDRDGSNLTQVLHNASYARHRGSPTIWSATGDEIIYSFVDRWMSIRSVNIDGSGVRELVRSTDSVGTSIGGQRNIAAGAVDCDGSASNLLYFLGGIRDDEWYHTDFFVIDLGSSDSTPLRLTNNSSERHFTLASSPTRPLIVAWAYGDPQASPSNEGSRLEIRDLCQPGVPVVHSWTKAELRLPIDSYVAALAWSSIDLLAAAVRIPGEEEQMYFIDIANPSAVGTAVKIAGAGVGFGEGVENFRAAWSPDGEYFAFMSNGLLYYLDVAAGTFHFVIDPVLDRDVDWRPTWIEQP
jgi:hypothetical protein